MLRDYFFKSFLPGMTLLVIAIILISISLIKGKRKPNEKERADALFWVGLASGLVGIWLAFLHLF